MKENGNAGVHVQACVKPINATFQGTWLEVRMRIDYTGKENKEKRDKEQTTTL